MNTINFIYKGSSMAAVLCAHLELENEKGTPDIPPVPKFVMLFSGFRPEVDVYDKYFNTERKLIIKSLHVFGEEDTWLNPGNYYFFFYSYYFYIFIFIFFFFFFF